MGFYPMSEWGMIKGATMPIYINDEGDEDLYNRNMHYSFGQFKELI